MKKYLYTLTGTLLFIAVLSGCRPENFIGALGSLERHGQNMSQATQEFTPEQEFYLGRAVSAQLLSRYPASEDKAANNYLNQVGQALAMRGARPLQNGYHFMLLDSPQVNAFAAPGGFVFVTTGMVGLTSNESELAAVLAHEIAHIQNRDAVAAIQNSRLTAALTELGKEGAGYAPVPGAQYLGVFSGAVDDVVGILVSKGYSRGQEYSADATAKNILSATGYDARALEAVLRAMQQRVPEGSTGFGSTHPSAENRLGKLNASAAQAAQEPDVRQNRFKAALGKYSNVAAK